MAHGDKEESAMQNGVEVPPLQECQFGLGLL
jgi:hypothetical protein